MKKIKKYCTLSLCLVVIFISLSSCQLIKYDFGKMKQAFKGRQAILQTYDEDSDIIDSISGKSISVESDQSFDLEDGEGAIASKSSVLKILIGGKPVYHVGSTLLMFEDGLDNYFDDFEKTFRIENNDRSVPFINSFADHYKNLMTGNKFLVLIRSQTGKPLATFVGDKVSVFATDIDKSTGFIIDGKYLFAYRCDYTVYSTDILD